MCRICMRPMYYLTGLAIGIQDLCLTATKGFDRVLCLPDVAMTIRLTSSGKVLDPVIGT